MQLIMSIQQIDKAETEQAFSLVNVVIEQNYFDHNTFKKKIAKVINGGTHFPFIF
jgi:hypothetical protein